MATNYTIKEAVEILAKGTDAEAMQEIGRRFPILAIKIARITAKAKDEFVDFMGFMPEYLTANKVNSEIKKTLISIDEKDDEEGSEKPVKAAKSGKKKTEEPVDDETEGDVDYNKYNGDTLIKMCKERGIYKKGMKKADLVAAMENYDGNEGESDDADDENENPYEGKSAMELYKECKKRGIKAAPKKKADFYANLLIEDDVASNDEEDDDWGDEDDEPVEPKKSGKGKASKKAAKEDEDEDDDWDI